MSEDGDAKPEKPPTPKWVLPHNLPEWLSACSNVALVVLAVATLVNTLKVSQLQDYWQSEVTRRNLEIAETGEKLDSIRRSNREAEARNSELEKRRQDLDSQVASARAARERLSIQNRHLSSRNAALATNLHRSTLVLDFRDYLDAVMTVMATQPTPYPYDHPINVGEDALNRLVAYLSPAPDGSTLKRIATSLRSTCAARLNTPLNWSPYKTTSIDEWRRITRPPATFSNQREQDAWIRQRDMQIADYNERQTRERAELDARSQQYLDTTRNVDQSLMDCGEEILRLRNELGAEPAQ